MSTTTTTTYLPVGLSAIRDYLTAYDSNQRLEDNEEIIAFVKKYYTERAPYRIILHFESQYNDETTEGRLIGVTVYDIADKEIPMIESAVLDGDDYSDDLYEAGRQYREPLSDEADNPDDRTIYAARVKLPTLYVAVEQA